VECGKSTENFHPGRDGNNYCSGSEVGPGVYIHSDCKHVVGPYNEAKEADGHYCSDHSHVAERFFFAGVISYNVGNYSKAGKNKNIYFGMAKESEEVLVEDGVPSSCRVEECCV